MNAQPFAKAFDLPYPVEKVHAAMQNVFRLPGYVLTSSNDAAGTYTFHVEKSGNGGLVNAQIAAVNEHATHCSFEIVNLAGRTLSADVLDGLLMRFIKLFHNVAKGKVRIHRQKRIKHKESNPYLWRILLLALCIIGILLYLFYYFYKQRNEERKYYHFGYNQLQKPLTGPALPADALV